MPRKANPKKTAAPKRPRKTKKKAGKPKYFTFSNAEGVKYEVLFRKPDERIYDGADEVHISSVAKGILSRYGLKI